MTTVGWIGLGAIGLPMAQRINSSSHPLLTCAHRDRIAPDAISAGGGQVLSGPAEVARRVDMLVSVVRDQRQTDEVLLGPDGALAQLSPGAVLIVMSTLSPDYCRELERRCAPLGVDLVDAPVSGGVPGARRGELTIMVGGRPDVVDRVRPVLDRLGDPVLRMGNVGAGQETKIVNNAIKIGIMAVTTEQLDVGVRAGLDLDALLTVITQSSGGSHIAENWNYYYQFKRDHRPGGPLDILYKDLALALDLARQVGGDVPVARALEVADVGRLISDQ